jgi:hypothetical protein
MNPNGKSTPIPMSVIRGTIVSYKESSSEDWNRQALRTAFIENGLQALYDNGKWGVGGISFNHFAQVSGRSNAQGGVGKYAAAKKGVKFANAINSIIQTPAIKELQLNGYFDLSIDSGKEMVVFKVDIEDGEVSYQQAEFEWPEKTILPH